MPKVSVIIPIYGVENYIERCVRSLLEQTLEDIEFIFVDDCTPDHSIEILMRLIEEYQVRSQEMNHIIKIERMSKNSGLPAVRRHGIKLCTGDYIIHCDSDDWVDRRFCEILYNEASENGYDIVSCDYYKSDGKEHRIIKVTERPELWQGPVWNKIVRRSLYCDNEIRYPKASKAEDGALMTQLSFFANKKQHIDVPLYYYYYNENSICNVMSEEKCLDRLMQEMQNTDLRIRFLEDHGVADKYKNDIIIWKYIAKSNLLPFISDKKCFKIWKDTYPDITRDILISKYFSFKTKMNFILRYLRIKKS